MQLKNKTKNKKAQVCYGDTIVEAVIAIAVYSIVAILALGAMNSGLKSAQKNLESTMSRAAVDTQVDSLRYIYENVLIAQNATGKDSDFYKNIWTRLTTSSDSSTYVMNEYDETVPGKKLEDFIHSIDNVASCDELMNADAANNIFAINPRMIYSPTKVATDLGKNGFKSISADQVANNLILKKDKISTASLYPRIIYQSRGNDDIGGVLIGGNVSKQTEVESESGWTKDDTISPSRVANKAEGVWIVPVTSKQGAKNLDARYDFYVRACWNAAGEKSPTTFTTVVRLLKMDK